mmetsp:Transcript_13733/g.21542  ORF Transcript_13733/g.21542 Transcript_13733/m.21542 type:complete len:441 (+) Transcript_13733:181-1503(+)
MQHPSKGIEHCLRWLPSVDNAVHVGRNHGEIARRTPIEFRNTRSVSTMRKHQFRTRCIVKIIHIITRQTLHQLGNRVNILMLMIISILITAATRCFWRYLCRIRLIHCVLVRIRQSRSPQVIHQQHFIRTRRRQQILVVRTPFDVIHARLVLIQLDHMTIKRTNVPNAHFVGFIARSNQRMLDRIPRHTQNRLVVRSAPGPQHRFLLHRPTPPIPNRYLSVARARHKDLRRIRAPIQVQHIRVRVLLIHDMRGAPIAVFLKLLKPMILIASIITNKRRTVIKRAISDFTVSHIMRRICGVLLVFEFAHLVHTVCVIHHIEVPTRDGSVAIASHKHAGMLRIEGETPASLAFHGCLADGDQITGSCAHFNVHAIVVFVGIIRIVGVQIIGVLVSQLLSFSGDLIAVAVILAFSFVFVVRCFHFDVVILFVFIVGVFVIRMC